MATYIPNVKDYIPKSEPYTPDFKFISDALANRQDRYDKNLAQLNNLYGQVVYADLSREDNKSVRDQYTKELAPKIQQVTGLDFSLAQNVDAAQALFKPFYDDAHIVRDLVYTKQYKNEMKKAEAYKNSPDKDANSKYWADGVKYMNYQMQDFKDATREKSMTKALPQYFQNPDLYNRALEVLTTGGPDGKGFKVKNMYLDSTGNFIVEQENGIELLSRPTGAMIDNPNFDPNKKEGTNNPKLIPEMYNPAGSHIRFALGRDPIIQQGMQVQGYVAARDWMEANKDKYGGNMDAAKNAWSDMIIAQYTTDESANIKKGKQELDKLNKTANSWDSYIKDAPLVEMSDEYKNWLQTIASRGALQKGLDEAESNIEFVNSQPENAENKFNRAMTAYVYNSIQGEIFKAAQNYADLTSVREIDENQFALEKYKADRREELARLKARLKSQAEKNKNQTSFSSNPFAPRGGNNIPGDANENMIFMPLDENGNSDFIGANRNSQKTALEALDEYDLYFIKEFYTKFADELNSDINTANMNSLTLTSANDELGEVSTAGIFVPNYTSGKLDFYSWDETPKLLETNPNFIRRHYEYVSSGLNNYAKVFPSIQKDEMSTFMGDMSELTMVRENLQTRYDITQKEMANVYANVIDKLGLNSKKSLQGFNFEGDPVDFMDSRGNIRTIDEIVEERKNLVLGQILPLLPRTIPSLEESIELSLSGQLNNSKQIRNRQTGQVYNVPMSFVDVLNDTYGADRITDQVIDAQWRSTPAFGMQSYYVANELKPLAEYLASVGVDPRTNGPMVLAQTYYLPSDSRDNFSEYIRRDQSDDELNNQLVGPFNQLQKVVGQMHGMINKEMSSINAIPGVTAFNFDSRFYGRDDAGDGAISNGREYKMDSSFDPAGVNETLKIFDIIERLPYGTGQIALVGDFGNAYSEDLPTLLQEKDNAWWTKNYGVEVPDGRVALKGSEVLKQIKLDLAQLYERGPKSFGIGKAPSFRIESFPYGGGKGAEGNQLIKKIILDESYARTLEEIFTAKNEKFQDEKFKIPNNTLTIFANRELYDDPQDPAYQYVSGVGFRIGATGSNGQDILNIDRGGKVVFEKRGGIYYAKEAKYTYDGTNYNLGTFTAPTPLIKQNGEPFSEKEVDAYYRFKHQQMVQNAQTNLQFSNNSKRSKTNDNSLNE
tara:strand:- start:2810 stop:6331 length:3522 start_codon:yes stop_codon:yes gene_type:complete